MQYFFIPLNVTFDENKQNWEHLNISFFCFKPFCCILNIELKNLTFTTVDQNFQSDLILPKKRYTKNKNVYLFYIIPQCEASEIFHYFQNCHILM